MRQALRLLVFSALLSVCLIVTAAAEQTVQITALANDSGAYDGQTVTVEGEAIGEILERGNRAWVNVSDGANAIGIWMSLADAQKISCFGDYKHVGDTVRITGVFSKNCVEHGGDVDIHCSTFEVLSLGHETVHQIMPVKVIVAALLIGLASVFAYINFIFHKKERPAA